MYALIVNESYKNKTKCNSKAKLFFIRKLLPLKMMSDNEHSESEFYCLDKLEYFRRTADTGLNCQRLGVMNQVFAAFLKAAI